MLDAPHIHDALLQLRATSVPHLVTAAGATFEIDDETTDEALAALALLLETLINDTTSAFVYALTAALDAPPISAPAPEDSV